MSWGFVPKSFYTIKPRKFMSRLGKTDGQREKRGHEFNFDIFEISDQKTEIKQKTASKKLLRKIKKDLEAKKYLELFFNIISISLAILMVYLLYYFIFIFNWYTTF